MARVAPKNEGENRPGDQPVMDNPDAPTEPREEGTVADAPELPKIDEDSVGDAADRVDEDAADTDRPGVHYVGMFSERRISREDWEQAGVSDQDGVTWTKDDTVLPIENFSEDALRVLSTTGEFRIVRDED